MALTLRMTFDIHKQKAAFRNPNTFGRSVIEISCTMTVKLYNGTMLLLKGNYLWILVYLLRTYYSFLSYNYSHGGETSLQNWATIGSIQMMDSVVKSNRWKSKTNQICRKKLKYVSTKDLLRINGQSFHETLEMIDSILMIKNET